jgi:hypothetical protein
MTMKIEIEQNPSVDAPRKYPYLAYDRSNQLCLVGKYAIIILDEKANGNGYSMAGYPSVAREDFVQNVARFWRVPVGITVRLSQ